MTLTWRKFGWVPPSEKPTQVAIAADGTKVEFREVMRFGPPTVGAGKSVWSY